MKRTASINKETENGQKKKPVLFFIKSNDKNNCQCKSQHY